MLTQQYASTIIITTYNQPEPPSLSAVSWGKEGKGEGKEGGEGEWRRDGGGKEEGGIETMVSLQGK